jgi:hypothetical protein
VYVDLPLHKWILEESLRQYEMDSEEYQATYPFPPSDYPPEQEEQQQEELSLENKLQSWKLSKARVPFTAGEAWSALTSSPSQERDTMLLQGITASLSNTSRKKRATTTPATATSSSGDGGSGSTSAVVSSPTDIFMTALTRAGLVPLPPHIRAIPGSNDSSNNHSTTGLKAIQSHAAFFPPLLAFTSSLMDTSRRDTTSISEGTTNTAPSKLALSTLNYKTQQLKVVAAPLPSAAADGAAGSAHRGVVENSEIGVQLPEIATEIDTRGHNVVFVPIEQVSGAEQGPLVVASVAAKAPSAAVSGGGKNRFFDFWAFSLIFFC